MLGGQTLDQNIVNLLNARAYAALQTPRRNAGNTAYEWGLPGWLDTAQTWAGVQTFTPAARTSGVAPYLVVNASADTTLTASTEAIGVSFVGAIRQHATGALTTQREYVFAAPTYSFAGASVVTTAVGAEFASPVAGTNATLTASYAVRALASTAAHVPFVAKGFASQTGDMFQAQNSSGTSLVRVDSGGSVIASNGAATYAYTFVGNTTSGVYSLGSSIGLQIDCAGQGGFQLRTTSGSTGEIHLTGTGRIGWVNGNFDGVLTAALVRSSSGVLKITDGGSTNLGSLILGSYTAATIGLTVKGFAAQSANLQEWQNSGATILTKVNAAGVIFPVQAITASAPTYAVGGLYFDTTLNKLRVGGASGWETVTSV